MTITTEKSKKLTNALDYLFKPDFKYKSNNPYHDRLGVFNTFVLRDNEAEVHQGNWANNVFGNSNPLEVEIGTGFGHFMMEHTQKNPNINFIGLDHRFKRSFQLANKLTSLQYQNFKYLRARGERLDYMFGPEEVSTIYYFFPDPWPKTRHHKKRLFQKNFLDAAYKVLTKDGVIQIKTDHDGYFQWMLGQLKDNTQFKITMQSFDLRNEFPEHFLTSFTTKFEKIFLSKGIKIKAMTLQKIC